jgi:bla regulator protein BlaR1
MNTAGLVMLERLGVALLHSLWQGALVGLLLFAGLVALRRATAQMRYLLLCTALALMLLLPVCTFVQVQHQITVASSLPSESRLVASAAAALEAAATLLPAGETQVPPGARTVIGGCR